jgi:hypothetical protein
MNFLQYDELRERCELYKIRALMAILAITGNMYGDCVGVGYKSFLYRCGDDMLSYHIHLADGVNLDGELNISILDMYLSGKVVEAKLKYKELQDEKKS